MEYRIYELWPASGICAMYHVFIIFPEWKYLDNFVKPNHSSSKETTGAIVFLITLRFATGSKDYVSLADIRAKRCLR